jgi:hypothetical protein
MLVEILEKDSVYGPAVSNFISGRTGKGDTGQSSAALRRDLRQAIDLSVAHSPSYLTGKAAAAERSMLFVSHKNNKIVGAASLATFRGYRSSIGELSTIGILGNLRIDSPTAGGSQAAILLAGIRALEELDSKTILLASVLTSNSRALSSFTRCRRCGLIFSRFARYHTYIVPSRSRIFRKTNRGNAEIIIRRGSASDIPALTAFLNYEGSKKEFYPQYQENHFSPELPRFPGLKPADILIAERHGQIVGSLGLWDQSRARRWFVNGYNGAMRLLRPLHNAWSQIAGGIRLPDPQSDFPYRSAICIAVENNNPRLFSLLIAAGQRACAADPRHPALIIGLAEADPLSGPAAKAAGWKINSELFHLQIKGSSAEKLQPLKIDALPYIEVGAL